MPAVSRRAGAIIAMLFCLQAVLLLWPPQPAAALEEIIVSYAGPPDQVRRVLRALVRALKYIQQNPEGTQQVMMSWLKLDREIAAEIYQMARNNYTKEGMVEEPTLTTLATTMLAEAGIKGVNVSQLVDFSLLRQVLK